MTRLTQFLVIFLTHSCIYLTPSASSTNEVQLKIYSKEDGRPLTITDIIFRKDRDLLIELPLSWNHLFLDVHLVDDFEDDIGKNIDIDIKKNWNCNGITPRYYNGKIRDNDDSAVNLMICGEIVGLLRDGKKIINIASGFQKDYIAVDFNNDYKKNRIPRRVKRDTNEDLPIPYDANNGSRYIQLALAVDYDVYKNQTGQGYNDTKVHQYWIDIVNKVNQFYKDLNMFVALVDIEMRNTSERAIARTNETETKKEFQNYTYTKKKKQVDFDAIILITNVTNRTNENAVELPANYKYSMSQEYPSYGLIFEIFNTDKYYTTSIAYLLGKFLHIEEQSDSERDGKSNGCIMFGNNYKLRTLSWDCGSRLNKTIEQLKNRNFTEMPHLKEQPKKLFNNSGPSCGNSFQEEGELCDCGLLDTCPNTPCCNAKTCRYKENLPCTSGECCNTNNCTLRNAGFECRKAEHECDTTEVCDGKNATCPEDVLQHAGVECRKIQQECDIAEFCDGKNKTCPRDVLKGGTERCLFETAYCKNYYCVGNATCPLNCSNNGVCDSDGKCRCYGTFDNNTTCQNTSTVTTQTNTSTTVTSITPTTTATSITSTDSTTTEIRTSKLKDESFFKQYLKEILAILLIILLIFCIYYIAKCCRKRSQWNPKVIFLNALTPSTGSSTTPKSPRIAFSPKWNKVFSGDSPEDLEYTNFPYPMHHLPTNKNRNKQLKYATLDWAAGTSSKIPERNDTVYSSIKKDNRHKLNASSMQDFSTIVLHDDPDLHPRLQSAKHLRSFEDNFVPE